MLNSFDYVVYLNCSANDVLKILLAVIFVIVIMLTSSLFGFYMCGNYKERTMLNYKRLNIMLILGTVSNLLVTSYLYKFLDSQLKDSKKSFWSKYDPIEIELVENVK